MLIPSRESKVAVFWNREDVFSALFFSVFQMFYAAVYSGGVVSHVHNWKNEINPHFLQVNHEALRRCVMGVHGPVSPAQQNTYRINTPINIPALLRSALLLSLLLSSSCPIIPPRRTPRPTRPVPSALPTYKMKMRGWSKRRRGNMNHYTSCCCAPSGGGRERTPPGLQLILET